MSQIENENSENHESQVDLLTWAQELKEGLNPLTAGRMFFTAPYCQDLEVTPYMLKHLPQIVTAPALGLGFLVALQSTELPGLVRVGGALYSMIAGDNVVHALSRRYIPPFRH